MAFPAPSNRLIRVSKDSPHQATFHAVQASDDLLQATGKPEKCRKRVVTAFSVKTEIEPEWAREKYITARFGLSHMILFSLRKAGKIRSLSLRDETEKYGARLFHVGSVRSYLADQELKSAEGA